MSVHIEVFQMSGTAPVTFRIVKSALLRRIMRGDWAPGGFLPNEVDLARDFGCARATVNRAMRELADEGIVERKRKAGTRVRPSPLRAARFEIPQVRREIEASGAVYGYVLLHRAVAPAPGDGAFAGAALHLICLHSGDGVPYQYEDRWINLVALPAAQDEDFTARGPNEWLVETVPYSEAEIGFSAIAADAARAQALGCDAGTALFQVDRTTWWQGQSLTRVALVFRPGHRMTTRY